jgi:cytoskeleton protein RodZ
MPSIGETLREARMRQHLDISDVEAKTKIRAKYLRALENEEFGMLPGPTFVKTFLRTYAEALGLDPHLLVEEYRAGHEPREELDHLQALGPPGAARDRRRGVPRLGPGAALVAVLVAVVALLLVLGLTGEDNQGGESAQPVATQTERQKKQPRRKRPRPAPTRVALRITPEVPTYVCVDQGLGTPIMFQGILDAPQTFRAKVLRVNLGKTNVVLRKNGRPFRVEPGPEPVGFEFRPKSTKALPFGERPCA